MTHRLLYLIGAPGSGKSTLMRRVTAGYGRLPRDTAPVPHDALIDAVTGAVAGAEIGRRRGDFSGTDALASTIIDKAAPWLAGLPYPLLLGEGARLGNRRFLGAAASAGYQVTLVLLDHADTEAWRAARSEQIGRTQNPSWVAGRVTASRNLAADPGPGVTVWRGHPDDLHDQLAGLLR